MLVQGKTIVAVALAASASSACGVGYYLGADAGGGNAGGGAGNPDSSAAVGSPIGSGETGSPSGSGVLAGSGSPVSSGVSTGVVTFVTAGSPFGSGVAAAGSPFASGTTSGPSVGSGVSTGVGTVMTTGSSFGDQSGTVFTSGATSGTVFASDATSGTLVTPPPPPPPPPGDVNAQAFCKVPDIATGTLPFAVDTAFVPSGWMGDAPAYVAVPANPSTGVPASPATTARMTIFPTAYYSIGDACTPDGIGRSSATAKGACWKVIFVPFPKTIQPGTVPGAMKIGGGPGYGWAGAFWQYPRNNWGTLGGGYPIPPGATTVSFWARGHDGGEKVRFFTGEGLNTPCSDYVATTSTNATFPNIPAWTHYTIDITGLQYGTTYITPGQGAGGYFGGVLGAFGFGVGDQTLPSLNGASAPPNATDPTSAPVADPAVPGAVFPPFFESTIQFYIDDIEFQ